MSVAEQLLAAAVDGNDAAVAHEHHAEHHIVEDGALLRQQRLDAHLVVLALADVGNDAIDPDDALFTGLRLAILGHPALDAEGVDDAVFQRIRAHLKHRLAHGAAVLAAVFRADQVGPGVRAAAHELARRIAGDVFDGIADEIDGPVGPVAEDGARHLRDDGAETLFALPNILEQLANGRAHLLKLGRQATQLVIAVRGQRRVKIAVRQAVGKARQAAQGFQQAAVQEQHDQRHRHGQLCAQHENIGPLLFAQLLLAARIVHLDDDVADAFTAHEDVALGAVQIAHGPLRRLQANEFRVALPQHLHQQHGAVAHHRLDQRMGRFRIHVPQRFLHAQRQDVGIALQGFVQAGARRLAFMHADQQIAAENGGHDQATKHHQQQGAIDRRAVQHTQAGAQALRGRIKHAATGQQGSGRRSWNFTGEFG